MITRTSTSMHALSWQKQLSHVITSTKELLNLLQLDTHDLPQLTTVTEDFSLRVPKSFVDKMEVGNPLDPLLLQVLPQTAEMIPQPGFTMDPLAESNSNPSSGLIHKYHGRVLLIVSGGCAINCRYCFRRHFPYQENNPSLKDWSQTLDYVRQDTSLNEVILSGGDPLVASDKVLQLLVSQIADIPHIRRLRIHTRLPLLIPERITTEFLSLINQYQHLKFIMVFHCNHAQELNDAALIKMTKTLKQTGVTLLNQTVFLKGINDQAQILAELSEKLFELDILPYYLHLVDKVQGAQHFDHPEHYANQVYQELLSLLPGFLIPKLVRELPGQPSKTPMYDPQTSVNPLKHEALF